MDDVVIVGAARTPQGRLQGQLRAVSATALGATAIRGAMSRARVAASDVDAVVMGQVLQAGVGQNPARQAALGAGLGWNVHAASVNKVCLSGLTAIIDASRMIRCSDAKVVVAGGMESMSNAPHLLPGSRDGYRYGSIQVLDHMAYDGLTDAYDGASMGGSTERDNARFGVDRRSQDEAAARSHQRAALAQANHVFDAEIVSVEVPQRRGAPLIVTQDEGIRHDTTPRSLSVLQPAFSEGGTITAGNSSQISDGASAVILTTRSHADERGWAIIAVLGASGQVAGPHDTSIHEQPAHAINEALQKQGLSVSDLDHVEINEAFAAVLVRSQRILGVDDAILNPNGGGIAIGHPIGASGGRLVVHAAHALARRGGGAAAVALCGGGGQGDALILTR